MHNDKPHTPPSLQALQAELEANGAFLTERMGKWSQTPTIHFILFYHDGQSSLLAETIETLSAQLYRGWKLSIFSESPAPDSQIHSLPLLKWIQVAAGEYKTVLASMLKQSNDEWFGLLGAGDQLEPQTLVLLVDYLNLNPSWKLIYTDEDSFDQEGKIIAQYNKPDFDKTALEAQDFLGNSLFFSRYLLNAVPDFAQLVDDHRRLGLKIVEQAGDYSIGHIPVILYHAALQNQQRKG